MRFSIYHIIINIPPQITYCNNISFLDVYLTVTSGESWPEHKMALANDALLCCIINTFVRNLNNSLLCYCHRLTRARKTKNKLRQSQGFFSHWSLACTLPPAYRTPYLCHCQEISWHFSGLGSILTLMRWKLCGISTCLLYMRHWPPCNKW
jgi:hypothetical protein